MASSALERILDVSGGRTHDIGGIVTTLAPILTRDNNALLRRWGDHIDSYPTMDIAYILLYVIVRAEGARILGDLSNPRSESTLLRDILPFLATGGGFRETMTSTEFSNFINEKNAHFEDGMPGGVVSQTAKYLSLYIRGDVSVIRVLLNSIARRCWHYAMPEVLGTLRAISIIFHTYYFYYVGNGPLSIRSNNILHIAGRTIAGASEEDWDTYNYYSAQGHSQFGIMLLTEDTVPEEVGFGEIKTYTIGSEKINFRQSWGEGLTVSTGHGHYFLRMPDDNYHEATDLVA